MRFLKFCGEMRRACLSRMIAQAPAFLLILAASALFVAPTLERACNGQDVPGERKGLLDFSGELGDDALLMEDDPPEDQEEEEVVDVRDFYTVAPSYRNLPEMQSDARLNDVCFVSPTTGWAVGDRGVILKTSDGGASWVLCACPTDATLFAVSFLDENFGIAVGGRALPSSGAGQGVLLRTIDGGETWGEVTSCVFPVLRDARILDAQSAWVAGDSSTLYPSGIFTSEDTGVSWTAVEGNRREGWRSLLYDPDEGAGLGVTTSFHVQSAEGSEAYSQSPRVGSRAVRDAFFDSGTGTAWLTGDQGLVMRSSDFGANWSQAPGSFPQNAQGYFDFLGGVAKDGFVGVYGAPGSLFFYSADGGATWNAGATGITTPIRRAFFVDVARGWAVGDFGTIIATQDGGRSWTIQRRGGSRAAILGVFGRFEDVPLEAFARLAGDEGYLTEVALVARETEFEDGATEIPKGELFNEAVLETGASGALQSGTFVLNPAIERDALDQILARFDAENDGNGLALFRERLVRLIRTWRPDVLLTADSLLEDESDESAATIAKNGARPSELLATLAENASGIDARPRDAFRELLLRELPRAIQDAADPAAYPEHLSACRLEPWKVLKARAYCFGRNQGNMTIDANYYCPTLGRSVGEIATKARAILDPGAEARPISEFQTLFSARPPKHADKTFFDGLEIPPKSDSRRAGRPVPDDASLPSRAGARKQYFAVLETLSRQTEASPRRLDAALAQLSAVLSNRDAEFTTDYIAKALRCFAASGNYAVAQEACAALPPELYDLPESRESLTWEIQFCCGTEPALRMERKREISNGANAKRTENHVAYEYRDQDSGDRLVRATELAEAVRDAAPDLFMTPEFRFPYAVAQLTRGDWQGAMRFWMNRSLTSGSDLWGARAAAEYWLRAPNGDALGPSSRECPLEMTVCRRAPGKPYLDGTLEPEIWNSAQRTPFTPEPGRALPAQNVAGETAGEIRRRLNRELSTDMGTGAYFLYDDEFLYLGFVCPKPSEKLGESQEEKQDETAPRTRDAAMKDAERVEVLIDLDGDYVTGYQFAFDKKGRVRDALWNDRSWNPEIYVAKEETGASWNLEIAVKLSALAPQTPQPGDVWRIAFRRVAPGVGIECWNAENSDRGENAYGILKFE